MTAKRKPARKVAAVVKRPRAGRRRGPELRNADTVPFPDSLRLTPLRAAERPVYALWVPTGGPDGLGSWLIDTADPVCNDHPAVFFSREHAERACRAEIDGGLACVVKMLVARDPG